MTQRYAMMIDATSMADDLPAVRALIDADIPSGWVRTSEPRTEILNPVIAEIDGQPLHPVLRIEADVEQTT